MEPKPNGINLTDLNSHDFRKELRGRCWDAVNGTIKDIPPLIEALNEAESRGLEVVPGLAESLTKRLG